MERQLDERSRAILDFERGWWQRPGTKDRAIRARFGHSPARYYQLLNHLIDSPDAMVYDPMLVSGCVASGWRGGGSGSAEIWVWGGSAEEDWLAGMSRHPEGAFTFRWLPPR